MDPDILCRRVITCPATHSARRVAERDGGGKDGPETDRHPLAHVVVCSANPARPESPADAKLVAPPVATLAWFLLNLLTFT